MFKLCVIGPKSSGKTSWLRCFSETDIITLPTTLGDVSFQIYEYNDNTDFSNFDAVVVFHQKTVGKKAMPSNIVVPKDKLQVHVAAFIDQPKTTIWSVAKLKQPYFLISSKTKYQIDCPLLYLLQQLVSQDIDFPGQHHEQNWWVPEIITW